MPSTLKVLGSISRTGKKKSQRGWEDRKERSTGAKRGKKWDVCKEGPRRGLRTPHTSWGFLSGFYSPFKSHSKPLTMTLNVGAKGNTFYRVPFLYRIPTNTKAFAKIGCLLAQSPGRANQQSGMAAISRIMSTLHPLEICALGC